MINREPREIHEQAAEIKLPGVFLFSPFAYFAWFAVENFQ